MTSEDPLHDEETQSVADRNITVNAVAPCYVFLASSDGSYMTGQTLHPNGGGHF